jgi:hypothetical protein
LRHETLQRFMLVNDSVTVAIEIPMWLDEAEITTLELENAIELAPRVGAADRAITGHIDFLQVRNGCVASYRSAEPRFPSLPTTVRAGPTLLFDAADETVLYAKDIDQP